MPQIWMDSENAGVCVLPNSVHKDRGVYVPTGGSAMKQSAKKSVLGKLDNVLHHKQAGTPFRNFTLKSNVTCSAPKSSLCNETLRKVQRQQNFKEAQQFLEKQINTLQLATPNIKAPTSKLKAEIDILDYADFPTINCKKHCQKADAELWSDQNWLSDDLLDDLLHGKSLDDENEGEKPLPSMPYDFDMEEEIEDPNVYYNSPELDQCTTLDIPMADMPNFDDLDISI